MRTVVLVAGAAIFVSYAAMAESALSPDGKVRIFTGRQHGPRPDPSKAVPMRLPINPRTLPSELEMTIEAVKLSRPVPGTFVPGGNGDGPQAQVQFAAPRAQQGPQASPKQDAAAGDGGVGSQEYGTSGQLYTMARVPGTLLPPYRQAGRLFFYVPTSGAISSCSAALIKPGIVVTAAHCIVPYGSTDQNLSFTYAPAYDARSPYPFWDSVSASVLSSWSDGTGPCATRGKICQDDVGIITLAPQSGTYIGYQTGWFGYSTNNYSYSGGQVAVAQLGYSSGYDGGEVMLRTDSQGSLTGLRTSRNTIIGSPLGDGSDGGPWVVNLGTRPRTIGSYGKAATHNIVVGVTSWTTGTTSSEKQAGASSFTSDNIGFLVNQACSVTPAAC